MRIHKLTGLAAFAAVAAPAALVWLLPQAALATAPSNQTISSAAFPIGTTLFSAVAIDNANGFGTGAVINRFTVGGELYFNVLTADHVISANGSLGGAATNGVIGYGSPQTPGAIAAPMDPYTVVARNGGNGTSDLALLTVDVGPVINPIDLGFWTLTNPIDVTSYAIPNPYKSGSLPFTQVGYGRSSADLNFGAVAGYQGTILSGTKRFQNNLVTTFSVPTTWVGNYTYSAVEWTVDAPSNVNGRGAQFPGDSGGPYLLNTNSALTPISVTGVPQTDGTMADIPIMNDGEFAVATAVFFNASPRILVNNALQLGDALTPGDIQWINQNENMVPEPATLAFFGLAALALGRRRRNRNSAVVI